jgi:putative ABC transport system permease protein
MANDPTSSTVTPTAAGRCRFSWQSKENIGWVPLRFALRDMRGGLRGFYIFIACIALGSMAIAAIGSVAASLTSGLARDAQVILGGDLSFTLVQREATADELIFLRRHGKVSSIATMRAIARDVHDQTALVEVKAVDDAYPLFGNVLLDSPMPASSLHATFEERAGVFGALVDPVLPERLNLKPGALITIGSTKFQIRGLLKNEPDKLTSDISFGPRIMMSQDALQTTGLMQPGSLVHWHYRLRFLERNDSDRILTTVVDEARTQLPQAGWDIRTRSNASPRLQHNVERLTQFFTIVGLTALLVGGVGVGNAVKSHLDRRRDVIAIFKALGAGSARIFAIYLIQVFLLALIGGVLGMILGAIFPFAIAWGLGAMIPLPINPAVHASELLVSLLYSVVTAFAFALWPLGRTQDMPVGALFRDMVNVQPGWPRPLYFLLTTTAIVVLASLAILLAHDQHVAIVYVAMGAVIFILLQLVATISMTIARYVPRPRSTALRMAVANIHRPNALTPTIVLSLGLGIALLVAVIEIDTNLRHQFANELPAKAPSFYFLDIPSDRVKNFDDFIRSQAPQASLEEVPMLRGRIISASGISAEKIKPKEEAAWVLESDRGITYSETIPAGSRLIEGQWWAPNYNGPPLVSFDKKIADGLGLKLGNSVTVNVLGRNITATIANMRTVDWESLSINFVMVFSPNAFRGAPHSHLATLTYSHSGLPTEEGAIVRAVANSFPMVTTVRVKEALNTIGTLVGNLVLAIRGTSAITLLSAALVLGGALAASHRHRVYDAVILKTLGATRIQLLFAYVIEYLLLGSGTALFGFLSGSLASWVIVTELMHLRFIWLPAPALMAAAAAVAMTVGLGLLGTFLALGQKPASVLRNL